MKRLFDTFISLLLLILLAPLMALIGILIKLESKGPIFFTQQRVGLNGRLFSICKFRSMVEDSEKQGSYNTLQNDPRITSVGRFIRSTSLDELPQLINILCGEMSIVGPRPDLMIQKTDYNLADWNTRVSVRPGITGLSQVNGRSNCTFEERLNYDIEYVRSHSLLLDLKILLKTFGVVFSSKNTN